MSLFAGFRSVARLSKNCNGVVRFSSSSSHRMPLVASRRESVSSVYRRCFHSSSSLNKFLTQGDQELAEFLSQEIRTEKDNQRSAVLPRVKGFTSKIDGSEVTLTKELDGEKIVVKFNVNITIENDFEEEGQEGGDLHSTPEFMVDLSRKGQTLTFNCQTAVPKDEEEDAFKILQIYSHDGTKHECESQYVASASEMDDNLYNLLMNLLDDRGINSEFAHEVMDLSTAHENKLYIQTLEDINKFLHS